MLAAKPGTGIINNAYNVLSIGPSIVTGYAFLLAISANNQTKTDSVPLATRDMI